MRNLLVPLLALIAIPAPAMAQDVFVMRKTISTPIPVTYTGTYSTTYGACSGGTQSAPITSCKSSRGGTVDNSKCAAVTTRTCSAPSCGVPVAGYWTNGSPGASYSLGFAATAAVARDRCNAMDPAPTASSICIWETNSRNATLMMVNSVTAYPGRGDLYAASCM